MATAGETRRVAESARETAGSLDFVAQGLGRVVDEFLTVKNCKHFDRYQLPPEAARVVAELRSFVDAYPGERLQKLQDGVARLQSKAPKRA